MKDFQSGTAEGAEWKEAHEHKLFRTPNRVSHRHFHTCVEKIARGTSHR
jgi:hypothetical protein